MTKELTGDCTMYRKNNASALLQKASSQLSGQKPTSRGVARTYEGDSEEEIDKYLSSLGKKVNVSTKFSSVDDVSISSSDGSFKKGKFPKNNGGDGDRSKFLKKTAKTGGTTKALIERTSKPAHTTSDTFNQTGTSQKTIMSPALNKVANLTSKYLKKDVSMKPKGSPVVSDSDLDMDMSQDSDVLADMRQLKAGAGSDPGKKAKSVNRVLKSSSAASGGHDRALGMIISDSKPMKKFTQSSVVSGAQQNLASSEESDSNSSFAKAKSFLKKGSQLKNVHGAGKVSVPMTSTPKKTSVKPAQALTVDTDEEDLAQFMQGLSPSPVAASDPNEGSHDASIISNSQPVSVNHRKDVGSNYNVVSSEEYQETEAGPSQSLTSVDSYKGNQLLSLTSLKSAVSEERPLPTDLHSASEVPSVVETDDETTKDNVLGQFGLSTLDDLEEPVQHAPRQKPSPAGLFSKLGLSTLDDLEAVNEAGQSADDSEGMPSPVQDRYASDFESEPSNHSRLESVNTISSVSEVKTASPVKSHYSDDFDSDLSEKDSVRSAPSSTVESRTSSKTRTDTRQTVDTLHNTASLLTKSYSQDSSTVSRSSTVSKSSVKSRSATSYSQSSRTSASSRVKPPKHDSNNKGDVPSKSVEVQTIDPAGLTYAWNSAFSGHAVAGGQVGGAYVDPSPIASHVVSADALEAMTAYSPAILALNDMLRQQLNLTRNFMDIQQRSYQSAMESIQPNYVYTTLEDTKQYIKRKQKPRLTFKQALKQVKEEMGL